MSDWTQIDLATLPSEPGSHLMLDHGGALIRRSVLPGGIRVLTEKIPATRSASIGAWVAVGSRDERDDQAGSTHFLEHLLFKGTQRRSAFDIAAAFDAVGGDSNAATSKNYTCYYARVVDVDVPMAIDVLLDMITSSRIGSDDFELERGVILEELAMSEDDPSDVVHEKFTEAIFGDHPLGRPIGGTPETIAPLQREAVLDHYHRTYVPSELVITAAGNVDHDVIVAAVLAGAELGGWELSETARPASARHGERISHMAGRKLFVEKPVEQTHTIVGWPGIANSDDRRFPLAIANTIMGGGMSSRLFQEIREKRGLAYTTYSYAAQYAEGGLIGAYAASSPSQAAAIVDLMQEQAQMMANHEIRPEELSRAIGQIRGSFVLGGEDVASRMTRLGMAEIVTGRLISLEESLRRYSSITAEDIHTVCAEIFNQDSTVVVVGPESTGHALT